MTRSNKYPEFISKIELLKVILLSWVIILTPLTVWAAPTTTISLSPASSDGNNGWYRTRPSITLSSNEPGTTYWYYQPGYNYTYSAPITAADGQYIFYYYSVGTTGTESAKQQSFNVDSIPPALTQNIALNRPAYASSSVNSTRLPANAFDGDKSFTNPWNSGTSAPGWIYVDLQQNYDIAQMRLTVNQYPEGNTTHNIYSSQDGFNWTLVRTLDGYTFMLQNLLVDFSPPLSTVRYMRVETVSSPSWVSWNEIEVYAYPPGGVTLFGNVVDSSRIDLSWIASADSESGIDHYEIYNATNDSLIGSTTATTYSHTGLSIPTTYSYYVKAVDRAGNRSTASNTLRTTVLPCITQPWFFDFEPNNSLSDSVVGFPRNVVPSYHVYGYINNSSDEDWYQAYAYEGQTISLSIQVQATGTDVGWSGRKPSGAVLFQQTGLGTSILTSNAAYTVLPGEAGLYSLRIWNNNNNSTATRYNFNVSVTPQIDTLSPSNITGLTVTPLSSTEVDLTWAASSDNMGPVGYGICNLDTNIGFDTTTSTSIRLTNLSPGTTYHVGVAAADVAGNFSGPATVSFTPTSGDTTPPTGSLLINAGASTTNSTSVTLNLTCSDPSGCVQMCISNNNSCLPSAWEVYAPTKSWTLTAGDGIKTLYVWFRDSVGNANTAPFTDSILLQTTSGYSEPTPSGQNVNVTFTSIGVTITYDNVATACTTTVTPMVNPTHNPPNNFRFIRDGYFDISTDCMGFNNIAVTLPYNESYANGQEANLRLLHHSGAWQDCTISLNTTNNTITGRVTSLSPFGIGYGFGVAPTGANTNLIVLLALLAISAGIFIIRRSNSVRA